MGGREKLWELSNKILICPPFLFPSCPFLHCFFLVTPTLLSLLLHSGPHLHLPNLISTPNYYSHLSNHPIMHVPVLSPCDCFQNCPITHFPHSLTKGIFPWHENCIFWIDEGQGSSLEHPEWHQENYSSELIPSCATKGLLTSPPDAPNSREIFQSS